MENFGNKHPLDNDGNRTLRGQPGDEKSEAQAFPFDLLEALGYDANTVPEGSTFEYRVGLPG